MLLPPIDKIDEYLDNLPNARCSYCGHITKLYCFSFVYEWVDDPPMGRKVHYFCPECKVMDTAEEINENKTQDKITPPYEH